MTQRASVLCAGQATLDHVFVVDGIALDGHKHVARAHHVVGGGVAANAAVTVARLGGAAVLVSRVGDDADGVAVIDGLRAEGVEIRLVEVVPGLGTATSAVIVASAGERTIVNHTPSALLAGPPQPLDRLAPDAVLVDARWPEATEEALRLARRRGVPGVVDVDRRIGDPSLERSVFELATHLVFGEDALRELASTDDIDDALRAAASRTGAVVAVTCGAAGVRWIDGPSVEALPGFDVEAVDTTAAGDVFHGAFALALAERLEHAAALRFASAAAALKCTRPGARDGIPRRDELDGLLRASPGTAR